jgi:hypothetical protein
MRAEYLPVLLEIPMDPSISESKWIQACINFDSTECLNGIDDWSRGGLLSGIRPLRLSFRLSQPEEV